MSASLCKIQLQSVFQIGVLKFPQIWDGESRGVQCIFLEDMGKDNGFCVDRAMSNYRAKQTLYGILE